ncbi:MAG: UDP-glucose 4-epimerase GalE [Rickettsiales bacterium]|nr:UDP-glucose 4-epimerase GalE [Rickettsiales bacterium]
MKKKLLVTGGTGYIGSHTIVQLLESNNYEVIAIDNFSNSSLEVAQRVKSITGKSFELIEGDIREKKILESIFSNNQICAVIHFAGLKAVGESEKNPLKYYDNNVVGSLNLLKVMTENNIKNIVFSSSATVYGKSKCFKFKENTPPCPINVYGRNKLIVENILYDLKKTEPEWRVAILRYFNPIGAHKSGLIGDNPNGIPNNLMPFISQVALGKRKKLKVFGGDYETSDGTGRRDYIHVDDLAVGHLLSLSYILKKKIPPFLKLNLGTGLSTSVLDLIKAFERVSCREIKYEIVDRRFGDVAESVADPSLAKEIINWEAKYNIKRMCEDSWRWQRKNPNGYDF